MKLCWDNIENIRLTKNGNFRDIVMGKTYYYKDSCENCHEPFLGNYKNKFCCYECCNSKENNPFYGKHHSESTIEKLRNVNMGYRNPMYGKHLSEDTKSRISNSLPNIEGEKHPNWKGGVTKNNLPLYDTYASKLEWAEEVRRNTKDPNILEARCTYCGRWFIPTTIHVYNRIQCINGNILYKGEQRFYCSKACKKACPIYSKSPEQLMKEDAVRVGRLQWLELNREVQPELRQMVLKRDGYKCINCGSEGPLHCHHVLPVAAEPLLSADIDNCITLCENCHRKAHKQDGCKYGQLRTEVC
jgi:hypothetical protein